MEIPYTLTARPDTGLYNGKLGIWLFLASEVMLFGAIFTAYLFVRLGAEDGTWPNHIQNVWLGLTNTFILIMSSITMVWAWVSLKERKFNTYRLALAITILCGLVFLCIKGVEYKAKFDHTGVFINEDAMEQKYLPELKKMDAFYVAVPSQHAYEIRGHLHEQTDKELVLLPDETPKYLIDLEKKETPSPTDANASAGGNEAAAGSEEKTITIDQADIQRSGPLLPKYGTYYAIYFLVTGLHALHIVGGVVVMLYFFFMGSFLYRRNPEQLSNRIEVTGIFWHFVDLVWITVFPILYLT